MSWHIKPNGDPGRCTAAEGACPYGGAHFESQEDTRKAFENAASFSFPETGVDESTVKSVAFDLIIEVNDSGAKIELDGKEFPHLDAVHHEGESVGRSKALAELVSSWWLEPWAVEEDIQPFGVIQHSPVGSLVGEHHANTWEYAGERYVVDLAFAEINPNYDWPYVGKEKDWRKAVDQASVLGAPEKEPEPVDPRALSLPTFPPGTLNPLLDKAVMEDGRNMPDGTTVKFLSVDQVRVACVKYTLNKEGEPALHSIETREGYRNQGYMKKLLEEVSKLHGGKVIRSSGSMTNDGYNYTRHLTQPRAGETHEVKWPDFGGTKPSFSFVPDWITGYSH